MHRERECVSGRIALKATDDIINALASSNVQQEKKVHGNSDTNPPKIVLLQPDGDALAEVKEKVELVTRLGTRITVNLVSSVSKAEKIVITVDDVLHPKENTVEMEVQPDSITLMTQRDLRISAKNIEMVADEMLRLESGSTMTINGSLIKIN